MDMQTRMSRPHSPSSCLKTPRHALTSRHALTRWLTIVLISVVTASICSMSASQAAADDAQTVIQNGKKLEKDRLWGDALNLYQKGFANTQAMLS